jgi:hypothetical protein
MTGRLGPAAGSLKGVGGVQGIMASLNAPDNSVGIVAIIVLLFVVAVLVGLIAREIYLRKKEKSS